MELNPLPPSSIRTVIVEDEPKSLLTLTSLLERYCTEVNLVGTAKSVSEGLQVLPSAHPDLVFMDIAMPDGNAFDLINRLDRVDFEIIFVTAYNEYALKAFEFSALHYILKPVNYEELQAAVHRYLQITSRQSINSRLEILNQSLQNNYLKISLPTQEGLVITELKEIIRIEADSNYSRFYLKNGTSLMVSKSLNQFEEILSGLGFIRIHNTHIINIDLVRKYQKGRGGTVILEDGTRLPVSIGRKEMFLSHLHGNSINMNDMHNHTPK